MGKKFDALEYKFNLLSDELVALKDELKAGKVVKRYTAINLTAIKEAAQEDRDRFDAVLRYLHIRLEEVKRQEEWVVVREAAVKP